MHNPAEALNPGSSLKSLAEAEQVEVMQPLNHQDLNNSGLYAKISSQSNKSQIHQTPDMSRGWWTFQSQQEHQR